MRVSVDPAARLARLLARRAVLVVPVDWPWPSGGPGGFGGRGGGGSSGAGGAATARRDSATYNFGGSVLDASPYPLRADAQADPDLRAPAVRRDVGGPLRIPGVYDGARTTFFVNYSGDRSNNLVDRDATVPTAAMRAGDFSGLSISPIDPITGMPFPSGRFRRVVSIHRRWRCCGYFPLPNLSGCDAELPARRRSAVHD